MILHKAETFSKSEMEVLQLEGLKKTVNRVFEHVPFYQNKFQELNITPNDIQTLDDLSKLPFTKNPI